MEGGSGWLFPNYYPFSSHLAFKTKHSRSNSTSALSSVKSDWQRVWKGENTGESRENVQECIIHSALSDNEMFQMSESSR